MSAKKPHPLALLAGKRIAEIRKAKKWTQADLGRRCGIGQKRVSDIERGVTTPQLDTLGRVAKALSVPPGELLFDPADGPEAEVERVVRTLRRCGQRTRRAILRAVEALADYRSD